MYGLGFGVGAAGATTILKSGGAAFDADAQSFFTANSTLTDVTTKNAINQFVLDLKSNSLWTLGKYLYMGFLGDSTKVKYNLFAPSSNVLTLSSGWTYDTQGMKGNGTSAYAQTSFSPSVSAEVNSKTLFVYSQTDSDSLYDIASQGDFGIRDGIVPRYSGSFYGMLSYNGLTNVTNSNSQGLFVVSRENSTTIKLYKGSSLLSTITNNAEANPSVSDYLGAMNENGTANYYSNRKISIYGRMSGISATQEANLKTCIETLLTTLSIPTW